MARVFIAESESLLRDCLRALLTGAGHAVVGEGHGPAAVLAGAEQAAADVLLLDLDLGGGLELLQALKRRASPATRPAVVTMSSQPGHIAEAIRHGTAGHVLKDEGADELVLAVNAVACGRRFFGPKVADIALQALAADDAKAEPLSTLSQRERQIVTMVVNGMSSTAIGAELHLSPKTVDTYRSRLMTKLGVNGVPALVRLAVREGLIEN